MIKNNTKETIENDDDNPEVVVSLNMIALVTDNDGHEVIKY